MKLNTKPAYPFGSTFEGSPAARMTDEQALRRTVMSCMLWEGEFYEDGKSIVDRISDLVGKVDPRIVADIACEARSRMNLRHVPLLITASLAKSRRAPGGDVARLVDSVIQRADELAELVAIIARINGVEPSKVKRCLSAGVKRGLAKAFSRFDEYQLAKYDREGAVRLRDVLFLCHAKPKDDEQAALWKRLVTGDLKTPDTWEVALSGGGDKKEVFERMIREEKLGYLALLRNLRNMVDAGCDLDLVKHAIEARKGGAHKVLPFRFVAAARACPQLEPSIDSALCEGIASLPSLSGETFVLVDVSGSMHHPISGRSDMTRLDAAAALASVINGYIRVITFSDRVVEVPPRRGMAGVDAVTKSQPHSGTRLGLAIDTVNIHMKPSDRLIVITDEQSQDRATTPVAKRAYMINVASAKNGVGYGPFWVHLDGFSENVIRFIQETENDH